MIAGGRGRPRLAAGGLELGGLYSLCVAPGRAPAAGVTCVARLPLCTGRIALSLVLNCISRHGARKRFYVLYKT